MSSICLISVATPGTYEQYARQLFESAHEHVKLDLKTVLLPARPGWPDATLYRYHVLLEHASELDADYLYLVDADMRFEAPVGEEILEEAVGTLHPGFWGRTKEPYYCGAFVGGTREYFLDDLAQAMRWLIDDDDRRGLMGEWHDETHLNFVFATNPPTLTLSPSYCYPDDASGYPWLDGIERKLVALDKSSAERNGR